ncbi:hypothetical protein [Nostoc sp. JL23]|uniref:hypothetical protein n=1 Tax=Nostoc sp. JL23 TaxID=2815394 RepID=UPI001DC8EF32|nr:hypothetical protein [Nostoc sp. JL23]MBN3878084.1 hypothetical protein [Nostoc sp. JL23]
MEIYVQSAGVSEQQDYIWQKITETGQKRVDEPILVKKFKDLLQTEAPSIFIGRESNKLILLVTGMKATQRKDYRNRTIRNSIALIAQDNQENEQKIRGIAVLALEGKLNNKIDSAIKEGGEYGFEISYEKIENTIKEASLKTKNSAGTKPVMSGKNSESNRKIIADELGESCLPEKTNASASEALVVVTGIKTEDAFKKAGVWRGLSNLVEKETLSPYEKNFFPQIEEPPKLNVELIRLIISLGVIGLIILWFLWSPIKFPPIVQNPFEPTTVVLAAISPDGQYFATADSDGEVIVQDTKKKLRIPLEIMLRLNQLQLALMEVM